MSLILFSDGHNNGFTINGTFERKAAFFNILVQPPEKKPPTLLTVAPPTALEALGKETAYGCSSVCIPVVVHAQLNNPCVTLYLDVGCR